MGGLFGGDKSGKIMAQAQKEANELQRQMMEKYEEALEYYEGIGVPPEEAQRIALEAAEVGPSALEDIDVDPRLRDTQMGALEQLSQFGEAGLTAAERAQQQQIVRDVAGQAQAQDKAILQNMAERGMGGSGAELIARLQGSQEAADRNAQMQAQLAGQAQNRALQAITQGAGMAGNIRSQDYGEQSAQARAADEIARFNAANRAAAQQQEEIHNKGLASQRFGQEMQLAGSKANVKTGQGAALGQQAQQKLTMGQQQAAGAAQRHAGKMGALGTLAGAGIGAYFGGAKGAQLGASLGGAAGGLQDGGVVGTVPNSNGGFEDGGMVQNYQDGNPVYDSDIDPEVVPVRDGDFAGDRVDARLNEGEMVLNVEQQQRLMELLKGLRDLQGLGDENIIEPTGGEMPSPDMIVPDETQFMNGGVVGTAGYQSQPQYADGGVHSDAMEPAPYKNPTDAKPRGLHDSLKHEKDEMEKKDAEQKHRKARIKAIETLINGGR